MNMAVNNKDNKVVRYLILALVLVAVVGSIFVRPARKPNVLLITIDALRPDHLGCYGSIISIPTYLTMSLAPGYSFSWRRNL